MVARTLPDSVDELAAAAGVPVPPASWRRHWPAFRGWAGVVRWAVPDDAAAVFDLPPGVLPPLVAVAAVIAADPVLNRLGRLWHFMMYHLAADIGDNSNDWPLPAELRGVPVRLFALAVLVAGTVDATANAADSGMPADVRRASLGFVGRRVREVRDRRGAWGVESFTFLRHAVRAELFRLGRLSFRVSPFPWPLRVVRHERTEAVRVLGDADDVGTGWVELVRPGDPRVEVHVPGGEPLDPAACAASFAAAVATFSARHAGRPPVAFTCVSWLLDPALADLLPPAGNIRRFAMAFHRLPVIGDHRQAYDLIFGSPDVDPAKWSGGTALQRAVAGYAATGHAIRSLAGFRLWDEVAGGST